MIHPAIEPVVRASREQPRLDPATVSIEDRRRRYREIQETLRGEPEPIGSVAHLTLALSGRQLDARLYVPLEEEAKALVLFFHGGGFVAGDLDTCDSLCRRLAKDTGMRFLSVDYRLAPEHPFPSAIDDAVESIRFVVAHVGDFGDVDSRLLVMGDSAGATLATVACALTRSENLGVVVQVVIYPTLGPEMLTDSGHAYGAGYLFDLDQLRHDYEWYLGHWSDHTDPRISPLMFGDLTGAAPAVVVVAECDPLRDEGVAYAGLLEHFGVPVELLEAEGMVHSFLRLGAVVPEAREIVDDHACAFRSRV